MTAPVAYMLLGEESPDSFGQGAGEIPGGETRRKVAQKHTAYDCEAHLGGLRRSGKGEIGR